ncbi:hypothetical protein JCM30237_20420 [Halolamina litorea]|uniref:Uncharacterized protein n=1 Tax=Halolamina litorea TaxID=1515593 RepID=A0ABD6BNA6_9EURY|nr:hypothetical protein [Halolamina litorea]
MESQAVPGAVLVVGGSVLYIPAMVPGTTWLGYLAVLPATLALIYGTLLVARSGEGRAV